MDAKQHISGPVPDTTTTLLEKLAATGTSEAEWARFARLYDPVCRYYLAILRKGWPSLRRDWDDDIVQETFLALVQSLPERRWDRTRGRFRDFLFGVVRNKTLAFARREGRGEKVSKEAAEDAVVLADDGGAEAERESLRRELWRMLLDRVCGGTPVGDKQGDVPTARRGGSPGGDPCQRVWHDAERHLPAQEPHDDQASRGMAGLCRPRW